LTPNAFPATGTVSHTISTAFGNGADAYVTENGGTMAINGGNGTATTLDAAWGGPSGTTNQAVLMRFDLSQVVPGSLNSARLDLTAADTISGTHTFMVYGLEPDAPGWDWNESEVTFNSAPGILSDSNSQTLAINNTFTTTSHPDNPNVLTLGELSISNVAEGSTVSLTNPNLAVFLNLLAYYDGTSSENVATLILQQTNSASAASFWSKEGSPSLAPQLVVDALLQPEPVLNGDHNSDGILDAADYVMWRKLAGTPQEYEDWRENYAAAGGGGSGLAQTPEPAASIMLLSGSAIMLEMRRRRLRIFGRFLQE
jgi:hypothetical protein